MPEADDDDMYEMVAKKKLVTMFEMNKAWKSTLSAKTNCDAYKAVIRRLNDLHGKPKRFFPYTSALLGILCAVCTGVYLPWIVTSSTMI